MQNPSNYEILGVAPNATDEEIRRAYRRKAKQVHPDVNKSKDAHVKFLILKKAFESLINKNPNTTHHNQPQQRAQDPFFAYNEWIRKQKAKAEYEAYIRYEQFVKKKERFRNSFLYYPTLWLVYMATAFCYLFGITIILLCCYLVFKFHIVLLFFLSPFICGGIFFIKWTGDWFNETKKYF
jgi:hypothetical protein